MRRYICPQHRGTCSCGRTRPHDPLTSGHFSAAAVIAVLFALGGIGKFLIWFAGTSGGRITGIILGSAILVVILAVIAGWAGRL